MIHPMDYNFDVLAEDVECYCPGGYHPVRLRDMFKNGRYKIVDKLGFGAFATVWLAEDTQTGAAVSLKIVDARSSEAQKREVEVLQHITTKGNHSHPGFKHISTIIDHFYHEGPNGRHLCIVTEVLGPSTTSIKEDMEDGRLDKDTASRFSRQALLALDSLHSCGVARGDLHMGNLLFRIPISERSLEIIMAKIGDPQAAVVTRKDGAPLEKHMTDQLVAPKEYWSEGVEELLEIQLVDFGEAFFLNEPPEKICTPLPFHPPELVLGRPLGKEVDIWNLGGTTYELVIGRTLFEPDRDEKELIGQFTKILDGIPAGWIDDAFRTGKLEEAPEDCSWAEPFDETIRWHYDIFGEEAKELTDDEFQDLKRYILRMLAIDPAHRPDTAALLQDPWFVSGQEKASTSQDPDDEGCTDRKQQNCEMPSDIEATQ